MKQEGADMERNDRSRAVLLGLLQAQRKLREILTALDKGIAPAADRTTLREWLNQWIEEVIIPQRRQGTKERYRGIIDRHIVQALGHIQLSKLAPAHVQAFEARLTGQGMKAEGVGVVHRVISGAMKHAMRMELVYRNPASLVSPPPVVRGEPEVPDVPAVRNALALGPGTKATTSTRRYTWWPTPACAGERRWGSCGTTWT